MKKHAAAWAKGLLQYGIGFGLLAYVVRQHWEPNGSSPGIKGLLEQTPNWAALAAVVFLVAGYASLQYYRWYVLVRALDLPFAVRDAFRLGMVGTFYSTFLPGSVGGDLVKAYFIARGQPTRRAAAVATVIADRLSGLFGLILYGAVVGGACWAAGDERIVGNNFLKWVLRAFLGIVAASAVVWVVLGLLPQQRADRFAGRLKGIPKLGHTLAEVWYAVWTYRQRPRAVLAVIALNAVIHTAMVLVFHLAVRVFPTPDPATLPEHFVISPIGYILQAGVPLPGGVGGAEAIFGYLYTLLGRDDATGVIGRLTLRVGEWVIGFAGYLAFLRMRAELPAVEKEAEEEGYGGHDEPPAGEQKVG